MSIKIIHTADLHLDSRLSSLADSEKSKIRRAELLNGFRKLVDYAHAANVQGVIIAGDLFDSGRVSPKVKKEVVGILGKHSDIAFFLLGGNHDADANDDLFLQQLPSNTHVFGQEWGEFALGEVAVCGIQANRRFSADTIPVMEKEKVNIVVLHGVLSKTDGMTDDTANINLNKCAGKNIDYMALGHYHRYAEERIDKRGIACYSGCLQPRGFDETGEKGFMLLEIDGRTVAHKFVPFEDRRFHAVAVDVSGCDTFPLLLHAAEEKLKGISANDAVKIVLTGTMGEDTDIDADRIKNELSRNFFYVTAESKVKTVFDLEADQHELSLKSEFRRVVSQSEASDEQKNDMLRYGLSALRGDIESL